MFLDCVSLKQNLIRRGGGGSWDAIAVMGSWRTKGFMGRGNLSGGGGALFAEKYSTCWFWRIELIAKESWFWKTVEAGGEERGEPSWSSCKRMKSWSPRQWRKFLIKKIGNRFITFTAKENPWVNSEKTSWTSSDKRFSKRTPQPRPA